MHNTRRPSALSGGVFALAAIQLAIVLHVGPVRATEDGAVLADQDTFFAAITKKYRMSAADDGGISGTLLNYLDTGAQIGEYLERRSQVSARCLFNVRRDGKREPSGAAIGLAAGLEDLIRAHASQRGDTPESVIAARVGSFAAAPPCAAYSNAAEKLLNDFSKHAEAMVSAHVAEVDRREDAQRVSADRAEVQRQQRQRENDARQRVEKEAEDRRAADAERMRQERLLAMKNGAKPESFQDYYLLFDPQNAQLELANPPLEPIRGTVIFRGQILREEPDGYLMLLTARTTTYVRLIRDPSSVIEGALRINGHVNVIGKHLGNVRYETVVGGVLTVPVVDIFALMAF